MNSTGGAPDTVERIEPGELPEVESLRLGGDFDPVRREEWVSMVAGVLRGSGYDGDLPVEQLVTRTLDDIEVQPLYTATAQRDQIGLPGVAPFTRGSRAQGSGPTGWDVRAQHAVADPEAVLHDLENGVTSLWLQIGEDRIGVQELPRLLRDVLLDLAPIALDAGEHSADAATALVELAQDRGVDMSGLAGTLGFDPLGLQARTGAPHDTTDAVTWAGRCAQESPRLRALTVDALAYHEAGGSDVQELGCALATGVAYLRLLEDAGLSVQRALGQLEFRYAATADQFATIAKLRAARLLWCRIGELVGAPAGQRQHAVSSWSMTTRRDPWVNMLRGTLACFGAGAGGADAITVLPFDAAIGKPDAFARRIARNTQTLLMEESNLFRVIDPAGGSWYVESLTRELAATAWEWFRRIEAGGGMAAALTSGLVADGLAVTARRRAEQLANREQTVVGVSEFPMLDERALVREPLPDRFAGGLPRRRHGEVYEALRDRSDAHVAAGAPRPTVLLVPMGSARTAATAVTFATGALQSGGIATATAAADGAVDAFAGGDATAVCLCLG
ncbi:MAG: methylmalonyl-CoA mutase subunit beta, partial [Actinomycetota bacterium]|nr:methylmalonyl-CoA mutase subunit beta [Actinomycetota bacterium]